MTDHGMADNLPESYYDTYYYIKSSLDEAIQIISAQNPRQNILHIAAQFGCVYLLGKYIKRFDINILDRVNMEEKTPLHYAIEYNQLDAVKFLLDHGADIYAVDFFDLNSLHYLALYNRCPEIFALFLHQRINWGVANYEGITPLMKITDPEKTDQIISLFPRLGEDLDQNGNNMLHHAACQLSLPMVKYWWKYGLSPQSQNSQCQTPWQYLQHNLQFRGKNGSDKLEMDEKLKKIKNILAPDQE